MDKTWSEQFNEARGSISMRKLHELIGIPKRTSEDWSAGKTVPPMWVQKLVLMYLGHVNQKV